MGRPKGSKGKNDHINPALIITSERTRRAPKVRKLDDPEESELGKIRQAWTFKEKQALLAGLKKYGSSNLDQLQAVVGTRNKKEIYEFIRNKNILAKVSQKRFENIPDNLPLLNKWLKVLVKVSNEKYKGKGIVDDYSKTLIEFFNSVALTEYYEFPQEPCEPDFGQIYRYLADVFSGHVPGELNGINCGILMHLLTELSKVIEKMPLDNELEYLSHFVKTNLSCLENDEAIDDDATDEDDANSDEYEDIDEGDATSDCPEHGYAMTSKPDASSNNAVGTSDNLNDLPSTSQDTVASSGSVNVNVGASTSNDNIPSTSNTQASTSTNTAIIENIKAKNYGVNRAIDRIMIGMNPLGIPPEILTENNTFLYLVLNSLISFEDE